MSPEAFDDFTVWHRPGSPALWLARNGTQPPGGFEVCSVGLPMVRRPKRRHGLLDGKPTTVFLLRFGHLATRNVVVLNAADAIRFLRQEPLPATPDTRGYVVVRTADLVLGCGFVKEGTLNCEMPRAWLATLAI